MTNSLLIRSFAVLSLLIGSVTASQAKYVPYAATDPYTLHMYHFEPAQTVTNNGNTTVTDLVSPGVNLGIQNTAKMVPSVTADYGQALCTSSTTAYARANSGLITPDSFWNPTTFTMTVNNVTTTVATGACTYEAILMLGRDPNASYNGNLPSQDQIISMENSTASGRPMQFRIWWKSSAATVNTVAQLNFIGAEIGGTVAAAIPLSGPHAAVTGKWYHVAATYNGCENTTSNVHLYWTALDSGATKPNELTPLLTGSTKLVADLRNSAKTYLQVGCQGRSAGAPGFVGYIDEVRISKIVRRPSEMLLIYENVNPVKRFNWFE